MRKKLLDDIDVTDNPDVASAVICDNIGITVSNQSDEQVNETLFTVMGFCLNTVMNSGKYSLEEAFDLINKNRTTVKDNLEKWKNEE